MSDMYTCHATDKVMRKKGEISGEIYKDEKKNVQTNRKAHRKGAGLNVQNIDLENIC
jgi:hypothetical protein